MKKVFVLIALLAPAFFFLGWIGVLASNTQTGQEVRVEIEGYDPRDLLAGHYILYRNNNSSVQQNIVGTPCKEWHFYGAHRFYVPQEYARTLDRLFSSRRRYQFEVVYSCVAGRKPIAKQLLIDGMDWRDFLMQDRGK